MLEASEFPGPRWGARAATGPDGRIYFTGGAPFGEGTAEVRVFDPASPHEGWRSLAPMSQPRLLHGAVFAADGKLYVMGGLGVKDELGIVPGLSLVERYDVEVDAWTVVGSMPDVRFDTTAVLGPGNRIYVPGGGGTTPGTAYADLFVYDVAENRWYP
jgi:N-acetylneuraminic acid mutarotase